MNERKIRPGDKVRLELPESVSQDKLNDVTYIRQIVRIGTLEELQGKELKVIRLSQIDENWAAVSSPEEKEYEVSLLYLKIVE